MAKAYQKFELVNFGLSEVHALPLGGKTLVLMAGQEKGSTHMQTWGARTPLGESRNLETI